jgi:uncharacterized membrane protein
MDVMNLIESLFRWFHVFFGILWIGLLYFFNFVNGPFAATMDGETKKKVVPELMPRALYWFRWGAAFTWITGVFLLLIVYYHGRQMWPNQDSNWGPMAFIMLAIVFLGVFVYDSVFRTVVKDIQQQFWVGLIAATLVVLLMDYAAGFSYRGYAIHLGSMFGTIMAFNVWFRIWPAQQKIITATKNGEAPDPAVVGLAGLRSRHNTYMSVPLVFTMISQHATWAANPILLGLVIFVGWATVYHVYDRAAKVKGF